MTFTAFSSPACSVSAGVTTLDLSLRLRELATQQPDTLALLHKEYGHWRAYRWQDVLSDVTELVSRLGERGLGAGGRFAVCGSFEPKQLLLALAALELGAQLISVPRGLSGPALQTWLAPLGLQHAYVQSRKDIAAWAACSVLAQSSGHLLTARGSAVNVGRWHSEAVAALQGRSAREPLRQALCTALHKREVAWVQEGSDWADGLEQVLRHWLGQGLVLAVPETQDTATRDRFDIQPTQLILSDAARTQVADELRQRVHPGAGWRARLGVGIVSRILQGDGRSGFFQRRVAQLQGLQKVAEPLLPAPLASARNGRSESASIVLAGAAA